MTEVLIPMEERICTDCGSSKTFREQWYDSSFRDHAHWYNNGQGGVICKRCYESRRYKKTDKRTHCLDCGKPLSPHNLKFCDKFCRRRFEILR